jgi:hypothetical protein
MTTIANNAIRIYRLKAWHKAWLRLPCDSALAPSFDDLPTIDKELWTLLYRLDDATRFKP